MGHGRRKDGRERLLTAAASRSHLPGSFYENEPGATLRAHRRVLLLPVSGYFRASTARRSWSLFILDLPSTRSFRASS
jgi:hypothetical protein